jgi:hypothetical protein
MHQLPWNLRYSFDKLKTWETESLKCVHSFWDTLYIKKLNFNHLKPNGNYVYRMLYQTVTKHVVWLYFVWLHHSAFGKIFSDDFSKNVLLNRIFTLIPEMTSIFIHHVRFLHKIGVYVLQLLLI